MSELSSSKEYLSSRDAARLYRVTNDYIARLCRKGRIAGVLQERTWMVEKSSLQTFFAGKAPSIIPDTAARSYWISEPATAYVPKALATPAKARLFAEIPFAREAVAVLAMGLLFVLGNAAVASFVPSSTNSAAVAGSRVESPFFSSSLSLLGVIEKIAAIFAPRPDIAVVPATNALSAPTAPGIVAVPVAPLAPAGANVSATNTYVTNTYPTYVSNIVAPATGDLADFVTYDFLNSQLERIFDTIAGSSGGGGTLSDFSTLTVSDIPDLSGVYLALTGGTLSGELVLPYASTTATSTLAGLALADLDCSAYNNGGALTTDSSGNVICSADDSTAGSGSPGGLNTYVQYNDGGSFGGDAGFTYSASQDRLTVSYASTTAITATTASTTNLIVSGISSSLLKTVNGVVTAAVAGTDYQAAGNYATFSYPFPNNATTSTLTLGGLMTGTSTIGALTATSTVTLSNYTNGGLAVNASGALYTYSTSTWSFASSTLLANDNTFSGTNTFSNTITGSITGNAGTVTNGVYTTTFNSLFDPRFITQLAATTSVASITTLSNLSILSSQVSDLASTIAAAYPFPNNATTTVITFSAGALISSSTIGILNATSSATLASTTLTGSTLLTNATTTNLYVSGLASSTALNTTLATINYASTTMVTASTASTTALIVSGLNAASCDVKADTNGVLSCGTDSTGSSFSYPFPNNATTSTLTLGGLMTGTSTIGILNATSSATLASTTLTGNTLLTNATTTTFAITAISGALLKTTAGGSVVPAVAGVDYAAAGASAFEYPFPSNATTTQIAFNGGATFVGATTTALAVTGSTTISSILNVGGAINANGGVVGNVTGDVSGNAGTVTDGVYTTTFNSLFDPRFITQLAATTSVASITTLSNLSILSSQVSDLASTIAAAYPFPSNATSTLIAFTGGLSSASTTLTGPFVFANATGTNATSTNLYVSGLASTTALNTTLATINYASTTMVTATTASTTALIVSGLNAASCDVKADTNGVLSCGTDSTGSGGAYPFALSGNATSTLTQFNAGLTAFASSTIGAGGQTTGLTISGGATTTGLLAVTGTGTSTITDNLNVQGQLKVGTGSIYLNGAATSTFSAGISTPSLTVTGVTGSLLKTMSSGAVVAAVAGTDYQAAGNYATFSYPFVDNATTSVITLSAGAIMGSSTIGILNATSSAILASTTLSGNTLLTHATTTNLYVSGLASTTALRTLLGTINYASTTMVTATAASTTNLVVSGLGSGAGNCLTTDSSGVVSTQSCGGSAYPFTAFTTFGTSTSATSSSLSTAGVFFASSTLAASQFPYASSTALTVSGQLKVGTGTGLALQTSGVFSTYAGTSCTNQAVTALNASGSGTCSSITDAYFSGTLGVSHGGTGSNLSATGGTSRVLMQTSVGGTITVAQLACSNLSNGATSCSTDTTNASNISSGTLGLARGGTGADLSATGGTSRVLMQTSSGATITVARLACSDLSNAATSCSTDATNASNISSGTLATGRGGTGVTSFGGTNTLLYTTSASTLSSITTGNNGVLVTSSGGVPSISSTLPSATQANITSLGTISSGTWQGSVVNPLFGGTGAPGTLSGFMYGNLTSAATAVSGTGSGDVVRAASPTISGDWVGSGSLSLSFPGFNVGTATGLCISTQGAYFSGTFTVTTCSSDERLKHDITYLDAPDSLEAIMSIKPARYVWNSDEASVVHAGFIAQDTLGFVPEAIGTTTGNPYYTFDNNAVLSYAVSALQEINRKVDRAVLSASSTATTTPEALADGPFAAATNALKSAALSALGALEDIAQAGVRKLGDAVYAGIGIFNKVFAETITATNLTASAASIDTLHTDYLCVGTTCVTADEFLQIMEVINGQTPDSSEGSNNSEDGDASSTPPTTDSDEDETAPDSQGTDPAADTPVDEAPVEPEVLDTPDTPAPAVEETP